MAGRREQQKAARERRILAAAERLFDRRGYAATGMEDIARQARLAVGTIYNYFPSKAEIVLALMRRETGGALAVGEALLNEAPRRRATEVVRALFDVYVELVTGHDRRQVRELLAAALSNPDIAATAFEVDLRLVQQLSTLLTQLRGDGRLVEDCEIGRAATTLYSVYFSWFMAFVASDAVTPEIFRREVHAGLELVMRSLIR